MLIKDIMKPNRYEIDDRYRDETSFDQKIRSMLVKLEQLGMFSLMRNCIAKWLKAHLKDSGRWV